VDVSAHGVDFDAFKQVLAVQFACQGHKHEQG
jgi:hypothetical protein